MFIGFSPYLLQADTSFFFYIAELFLVVMLTYHNLLINIKFCCYRCCWCISVGMSEGVL
jgi:hypothetical protein